MISMLALIQKDGKELLVKLFDEWFGDEDDAEFEGREKRFCVTVENNPFKEKAEIIDRRYFPDIKWAKQYALGTWSVDESAWKEDLVYEHVHKFKYTKYHGWMEPVIPEEDARVVFQMQGDEKNGKVTYHLCFTGNPEGLRYLASLLLCGSFPDIHSEWHHHLQGTGVVEANIPISLVHPESLLALEKNEYFEIKSSLSGDGEE